VGKRSGQGFVAHKATLVNALSRALSDRVVLLDYTIGRRGLLGYLKALGGSNIVKVIPSSGSASESQATSKRLKVTCGSNTSYLEDSAFVGEKTPLTLCEVRISPNRTVKPNISGLELSEALNRVIPFTATDDARPVLQCVKLIAKEGKLTLVSADGFRLAVVTLDFDGEGEVLINASELRGIANALRKAKRLNMSFEASGESLVNMSLIIDTELIRYKWVSFEGNFPDYEKLIPTETKVTAHLDTVEASKAIASLKALADSKDYPIDISLNGGVVMSSPDDRGEVTMPADIEGGEVKVRIAGGYLIDAMRACGGLVDLKVTDGKSPILFTVDGYQLVVMPMLTADSKTEAEQAEPEAEAEQAEPVAEPTTTEPEAEAEPVAEKTTKRNRKKQKVAVTT